MSYTLTIIWFLISFPCVFASNTGVSERWPVATVTAAVAWNVKWWVPAFIHRKPKCQVWHWRWVGAHTRSKNKDRLQCVRFPKWSFHGTLEGIRWLCYGCHFTTDGYLNCQQADSVPSRGVVTSCPYQRFFFFLFSYWTMLFISAEQAKARARASAHLIKGLAGTGRKFTNGKSSQCAFPILFS